MVFNYPPLLLCSAISTLLPFLASTFFFGFYKKYSKASLGLWAFFALAAITETGLFILNSQKKPSTWISPIYTLIEYPIITIILASWQTKLPLRRLMRISIPLFMLFFALITLIGLENLSMNAVNHVTRPLAVLLLGTFAFITLQTLWHHPSTNLIDDARFWMLLAMALYYSASLALFAFMFSKDRSFLMRLLEIHAVVNIIHNLLFTIGVLRVRGAEQATL